MKATLIHTARFDAEISALLNAEEISEMEFAIGCAPETHPVVKDTGGVRKARWARQGRGKSGGIRVIYFYVGHRGVGYLKTGFPKKEKENTTAEQKKAKHK